MVMYTFCQKDISKIVIDIFFDLHTFTHIMVHFSRMILWHMRWNTFSKMLKLTSLCMTSHFRCRHASSTFSIRITFTRIMYCNLFKVIQRTFVCAIVLCKFLFVFWNPIRSSNHVQVCYTFFV